MRTHWLALAMGLVAPQLASAQVSPRPIVVELFTSQGCSSCPPADEIVVQLARDRADVLPLTFHVTYWNSLGWSDPFSFAGATERQRRYVAQAVGPEVYTPAMVVDGHRDVIGSDRAAVKQALVWAESDAVTAAPLEVTRAAGGVSITIGAGRGRGQVLLVGYDRKHETRVGRGENTGRTLIEANIVRSLAVAGTWTGPALQLAAALPAGEAAAVLLQGEDGRILGAARLAP